MSILKVARLGHPVLRQVAEPLSAEEIRAPETRRLVQDMVETMHEYGGVGLAAPQVHVGKQLALVEFEADGDRYDTDDEQPLQVLFNPKVTVLDATTAGFWEGCLSVPGLRGWVERPRKVQVDYLDADARPVRVTAEGFLATVLQHELDHLDGVLYVDKIADPDKFSFIEEFGRYHARADDSDADE